MLTGHQFTDQQGGRQNSNLVTLAGVYTATSKLVIDGRYSRGFLNEKLGNYFVPETVQIFSCGTAERRLSPAPRREQIPLPERMFRFGKSYDFSGAYIFNAGGQHELRGGYQRFTIFNDVQSGNQRDRTHLASTYGTSIIHADRRECNRYARSGRLGFFPAYRNERTGIESEPGHFHPGQVSAD